MRKIVISITLILSVSLKTEAQEIQFTQFYAAPMFLNPAFTGVTYEHRFTANYRNQWPGVKRSFTTYMATYDYNLTKYKSGIGGFVLQDRAGISNLVTTQAGLNLAYGAKIDKQTEIRAGAMLAFSQKKIDNGALIFNDQLISGTNVSQEPKIQQSINYADLGAGVLLNATKYWFGVSVKHLNKPNMSLEGKSDQLKPFYISVHGGYRYMLSSGGRGRTNEDNFISANVHYRNEQKYDQLDIGANYYKSKISVGLWYRGLPLKTYKSGYPTRESIALLLGMQIPDKDFRIGYSYDVTISKLGLNNTFGAHEISMVYEIGKKSKRKKAYVVCPKF